MLAKDPILYHLQESFLFRQAIRVHRPYRYGSTMLLEGNSERTSIVEQIIQRHDVSTQDESLLKLYQPKHDKLMKFNEKMRSVFYEGVLH